MLETDAAATTTFEVMLVTEPTEAVTVTPRRASGSRDVTVSGALTFTPGDWMDARTVTVTVAPDPDFADDVATVSHEVESDGDYDGFEAPEVTVAVTDDEMESMAITLGVSPEVVFEHGSSAEVVVTAEVDERRPDVAGAGEAVARRHRGRGRGLRRGTRGPTTTGRSHRRR